MISTPVRRRAVPRIILIALVLSLMVHLFGGELFGVLAKLFAEHDFQGRERLTQSDIIRLEHPQPTAVPQVVVQPKPVIKPPPPPPPPPHIVQQTPVHVITPPQEIVHIVAHAPPQTRVAPGKTSHPSKYYSDQQVQAMTDQFAKTIAAAHQDAQSVTAQVAATAHVDYVKHFQMHYNGIHEGMSPGDGIISQIKRERHGDTMYYWTHYEYMYADGHVEEDDIPWVFKYPINDDPFSRGDRRIPLQPPPAGYVPDRPLKPILEQFFGGPAVG